MRIDPPGARALDYEPCRYGTSKLLFRGPMRRLDPPYHACIGGTETYGRFVAEPFAVRLEARTGQACVNLGSVNAGLDSFAADPEVHRLGAGAARCILQVMGAQDLSNAFYRVHPRRNDRFLAASDALCRLYPEVDFTEFHFNRHMLATLIATDAERFARVRADLQRAWLARMRQLLAALGRPVSLLWLRVRHTGHPLGADPLMVDTEMVAALRPQLADLVALDLEPAARAGDMVGMVYGPLEAPMAAHMLGPASHDRIAAALAGAAPE